MSETKEYRVSWQRPRHRSLNAGPKWIEDYGEFSRKSVAVQWAEDMAEMGCRNVVLFSRTRKVTVTVTDWEVEK